VVRPKRQMILSLLLPVRLGNQTKLQNLPLHAGLENSQPMHAGSGRSDRSYVFCFWPQQFLQDFPGNLWMFGSSGGLMQLHSRPERLNTL